MSNFFSPPPYLCAVTYMTEISLFVTLNNLFTSLPLGEKVTFSYILIIFFIEDVRRHDKLSTKIWTSYQRSFQLLPFEGLHKSLYHLIWFFE